MEICQRNEIDGIEQRCSPLESLTHRHLILVRTHNDPTLLTHLILIPFKCFSNSEKMNKKIISLSNEFTLFCFVYCLLFVLWTKLSPLFSTLLSKAIVDSLRGKYSNSKITHKRELPLVNPVNHAQKNFCLFWSFHISHFTTEKRLEKSRKCFAWLQRIHQEFCSLHYKISNLSAFDVAFIIPHNHHLNCSFSEISNIFIHFVTDYTQWSSFFMIDGNYPPTPL